MIPILSILKRMLLGRDKKGSSSPKSGSKPPRMSVPSREVKPDTAANVAFIREQLKECDDLIVRKVRMHRAEGVLLFLSTIVDKERIEEIIKLMVQFRPDDGTAGDADDLLRHVISAPEASTVAQLDEAVRELVYGGTIVMLEGFDVAVAVKAAKYPQRQPSEPNIETTSRGSQIGFIEMLDDNIALIRHFLRTNSLAVRKLVIGRRTQTEVAVCYIRDVINPVAVETVMKRLRAIDTDMITQTADIAQFISDNKWTPFPLFRPTSRIDNTVHEINEGKFAIMVEGDSTVILAPCTIQDFYQTQEDYAHSFFEATFTRWLRLVAFFLALIFPSLYIALTEFNPELLPLLLGIRIASSRSGVPFPAAIEVLMMEIVIEILREATMRMPKQMGQTIGIVGGLVIGQATVSAGLVSNILIVIIATTTIATFVPPSYEISVTWRILKYFLYIGSTLFGLFGLLVVFLIIMFHLFSLKSFGVEYVSPMGGKFFRDWKDFMVRLPPAILARTRTHHLHPRNMDAADKYEDPLPYPDMSKEGDPQ